MEGCWGKGGGGIAEELEVEAIVVGVVREADEEGDEVPERLEEEEDEAGEPFRVRRFLVLAFFVFLFCGFFSVGFVSVGGPFTTG